MKQIPANSNDATTGHKLQGMSKDVIVVTSWPTGGLEAMFKNWEYVVLSRVCTLSGFYPVEPIDMEKLFKPSSELKCKTSIRGCNELLLCITVKLVHKIMRVFYSHCFAF